MRRRAKGGVHGDRHPTYVVGLPMEGHQGVPLGSPHSELVRARNQGPLRLVCRSLKSHPTVDFEVHRSGPKQHRVAASRDRQSPSGDPPRIRRRYATAWGSSWPPRYRDTSRSTRRSYSMVNRRCSPISLPRSHVSERRRATGSVPITVLNASRTSRASRPLGNRTSTTKRD